MEMGDGANKINIEEIVKNLDKLETLEKKIEYLKQISESVEDKEVKEKIQEIINSFVKKKNEPRIVSLNIAPIHVNMEEFAKPVTQEKMERPTITKEVEEEKSAEKPYTLTSEMVNAEYQRMNKELTRRKEHYENQEFIEQAERKMSTERPFDIKRQNLPGLSERTEALKKEQEIYTEKELIQKYEQRRKLKPGEIDIEESHGRL